MDTRLQQLFVVSLWSPDLESAAAFYQQAIGLVPLPHPAGNPHFQLGETLLVIHKGTARPALDSQPPDFPLLAITVPDLEQALARLERNQVPLPFGVESGPALRWVKLYDPAGNLIELVEQLAEPLPHTTRASFFSEYLLKTGQLHEQMRQVLSGLPVVALDWKPFAGSNSLAVLAVHTAGAYRYWLSDVIAGRPSGRDREAEFEAASLPLASILQQLDGSLELLQSVLSHLTLEDLDATRTSPRDGEIYIIGRVLLHVYEHACLHLGHMQITRQLWEARQHVA